MPARRSSLVQAILLFSSLFLALCSALDAYAQEGQPPRKIAVFGSSVASGAVDHQNRGGYAGRLGEVLTPRGWDVVNVSRGGDNTVKIAPRFEADLLPQRAGYVIIGLSLSNEGIAGQPDTAYRDKIWEQWRTGMLGLIQRCREAGMRVVVGNCYARNTFRSDAALYDYTRRMNVEISRWDVPSINFLGAIDDGSGGWMPNFEADDGHPNGSGHREMCYAIVPSVFEALEADKPILAKAASGRYAHVEGGDNAGAPLVFTPADPIHSFAISFWVRPSTNGALAAIAGKAAVLRTEQWQRDGNTLTADFVEASETAFTATIECRDGEIAYITAGGAAIAAPDVNGDVWRHIVLSHACARGVSQLYVDGTLIGAMNERIVPEGFYLGGGSTPGLTAATDVKEWAVYRSSLDPDAVRFLHEGSLFQSSLEVYALLNDLVFAVDASVENRAPSMSQVRVVAAGMTTKTE